MYGLLLAEVVSGGWGLAELWLGPRRFSRFAADDIMFPSTARRRIGVLQDGLERSLGRRGERFGAWLRARYQRTLAGASQQVPDCAGFAVRDQRYAQDLQVCESCHEPAIATMGVSALPTARLRSHVEKFHQDHALKPPAATQPAAPETPQQPAETLPCLGCHSMDVAAHVQKAGGSPDAGCNECHPSPHVKQRKR